MTKPFRWFDRALAVWERIPPDLRFRIERWIVAFVLAISVLVGYFLFTIYNVERFTYEGVQHIALWTAFDDFIPLVPLMFWPYSLYYFIALAPVPLCRNRTDLVRMGLSYILVTGVAWICWYFIPVRMEYPELACSGFSCDRLRDLYATDAGVNVFPSLHAAHSLMVAAIFWSYRRRVPNWVIGTVWVAAVLVAISTVLLKQHYLIDVPVGVLLGLAGWNIALWATPHLFAAMEAMRKVGRPKAATRSTS